MVRSHHFAVQSYAKNGMIYVLNDKSHAHDIFVSSEELNRLEMHRSPIYILTQDVKVSLVCVQICLRL